MMEEEIERTREEIRGIEEACEKVEKVLDTITKDFDGPKAVEGPIAGGDRVNGEGEHMQDVVEESPKQANRPDTRTWFENKDLLALWDGTAVV